MRINQVEYLSFWKAPSDCIFSDNILGGDILLTADAHGLSGLYFAGQKLPDKALSSVRTDYVHGKVPVLSLGKKWLDMYFVGKKPDFMPPVSLHGTLFQKIVWNFLLQIPYGKAVSYGDLALRVAKKMNLVHMSARAVGQAVGRNPVSIIIPCHRVVAKNGKPGGYSGGLARKRALLALEGINTY